MKMYTLKSYLAILIIFLTNIGYSQHKITPVRPYEKLVINGLNPIWYETMYDSTFIGGDTCDGYNLFERNFYIDLIYEDSFFYKISHKWGVMQANGTYIEKRNLNSGQLVWQNYYGLPVDDYQEFGRLMFLNKENNLEVISQLKPTGYADSTDLLFTYENTILTSRIYNKENGNLLYYSNPDIEDTTLFRTDFSIWINPNDFLSRLDDSLYYYEFQVILNNGWHLDHLFASIHWNMKKDDVRIKNIKAIDAPTQENVIRISDHEYLLVEKGRDTGQVILLYLDSNFNEVERQFSEFIGININSVRFHSFDPMNNTILISYRHPSNWNDPTPYDLILLSREGKILRRTTLDPYYTSKFALLSGNNHENITLIACGINSDENQRWYSYIDILDWSEDSTIITNRFNIQDSLRIIADLQVHNVRPNHVLLNWWERSYYHDDNGLITFDVHSSAISWAYFKTNDLIAKTKDIVNVLQCRVFPNPAKEFINIEFEESVNGKLLIHDVSGRYITSIPIQNEYKKEIEVSYFLPGMYTIYFQNTDVRRKEIIRASIFYKN